MLETRLTESQKIEFADAILRAFDELGLGLLSKTDFEAYVYHHLHRILDPHSEVLTRFDWMSLLKVTPTKLRSLQQVESARFLSQELSTADKDNWRILLGSLRDRQMLLDDAGSSRVQLYVESEHAKLLIEKFFAGKGTAPDYRLNANILAVDVELMFQLVDAAMTALGCDRDEINLQLANEIRTRNEIEHAIEHPIQWLKYAVAKLKAGNTEASRKDASIVLSLLFRMVKSRVGL